MKIKTQHSSLDEILRILNQLPDIKPFNASLFKWNYLHHSLFKE